MSAKSEIAPPPGSAIPKTANKKNYLTPEAARRLAAILEHSIKRLAIIEEVLWERLSAADNDAAIGLWLGASQQLRTAHGQLAKLQADGGVAK